jgi:hypothetical protein
VNQDDQGEQLGCSKSLGGVTVERGVDEVEDTRTPPLTGPSAVKNDTGSQCMIVQDPSSLLGWDTAHLTPQLSEVQQFRGCKTDGPSESQSPVGTGL